ncbi:hypothetical protein ACQP2P_13960 [Dactylosporangium sp. CA-139114]|uniref:hypothetical protein n=1 Tax=Dactylosporangium sp. CA-139114 TaxID=3239931 RepID=UPI003D9A05C7
MAPDDPPPPAHVRVDVTVTLHRRLGWLLAGVALGGLPVPDLVVRLAGLILLAIHNR